VLDGLELELHRKCLRTLHRICGRQALLPKSLAIPLCYDPVDAPLCRGGFADVWKCRYDDREVAVKDLKGYRMNDLEKIRKVGCPQIVACINELTVSRTDILSGGCDMEDPSSSKCVAVAGCNDVRESVRDGIGLDGRWQHQRVCEGACGRRSVEACTYAVRGPYSFSPLTGR
jgi:hypothetical protein